MPNRARGWLRQAGRDLEQATDSASAGRHEWACLAAQQAAGPRTLMNNLDPEVAEDPQNLIVYGGSRIPLEAH